MNDLELGISIARCPEVEKAENDPIHKCAEIVAVQKDVPSRHVPEGWFGNLPQAMLLFVSSNPSIDGNHDGSGENYPRVEWSDEKIGEWIVRRVDQTWDKVPVTFNHSSRKSFLWRCIDEEYRGAGAKRSSPQPSWNKTHGRAVEILGPLADPSRNYALTEVVHCKSQSEVGVAQAVSTCTHKWLQPIMHVATEATVVVLAGSKVRDLWARKFFNLPKNYGASRRGKTEVEISLRDTFVTNDLGPRRLVIYMGQPAFSPKIMTMYGPHTTQLLGRIARKDMPVPQTTSDWHLLVIEANQSNES